MTKEKKQKYRVSGTREFAFVTQPFSVRQTQRQHIEKIGADKYEVTLNDQLFTGEVVKKRQNNYSVIVNGNTYHFQIDREESVRRKKARGGTVDNDKTYKLKAPMPGKICEVFVSKGIEVKQGEPILILEAMKMQNQILSSENARVVAIHVKKNDNVLGDQLLIEMERI
jgi:propionyl-CoA carboxylase alpha chain